MLTLRDLLQIKRYTQTKSKRLGKDISCEWKRKGKARVAIHMMGTKPPTHTHTPKKKKTQNLFIKIAYLFLNV